MPASNPNIIYAQREALIVGCNHCGAAAGELCWTLKDGNGPRQVARHPHRARLKALVKKRMRR